MLKLLLVDDEYIVLKGLEIVLRDQKEVSLEIRTAIDAVDAYEKAEAGRRMLLSRILICPRLTVLPCWNVFLLRFLYAGLSSSADMRKMNI